MKDYWMELTRAPEEGTGAGTGEEGADAAAAAAAAAAASGNEDGNKGGAQPKPGEAAADAAAAAEAEAAAAEAAKAGKSEDGKRTSIYEDAGLEEPGKEKSTTWPEDWREQMADGDEKTLQLLKRYGSPLEVGKAQMAIRQRIATGEYKRTLPEDATEEQLKEWRTEQGIPEDPSGYELPVTLDGAVEDMNESQKAVYESWQSTFHEMNIPADQAAALTKHANEIVETHLEAQAASDAKDLDAFEDDRRAKWGADFRVNGKMNAAYLTKALGGEEQMKAFVNARMPDGTLIKNSAAFADMIQNAARAEGMSGNYETGEVSGMTDIAARKAAIEEIQRTDISKYTPALRKEYGEILEKMDGKADIGV